MTRCWLRTAWLLVVSMGCSPGKHSLWSTPQEAAAPAPRGTADAAPTSAAARDSYDACLAAMGTGVRRSALSEIVDGLEHALPPTFPFHGWNVGKAFAAGRINLLIPPGSTPVLPKPCGVDPGYPTCWSRPSEGVIICSAAMGRHVERREFEPPFSVDVQLAARYFLALALGHELGHLALDGQSNAESHWRPPHAGALTCEPSNALRLPLENSCDAFGATVACPATQPALSRFPVGPSNGTQLKRLMALEQLFDSSWTGDALCLSSYEYDSTAARVQRFGESYLRWFAPVPDAPVQVLASDIAQHLHDVERRKKKRDVEV
jgi:hypothetical protein